VIADLERLSIRRHQAKHFVEGIRKLGLESEPTDVLRCAKYHYFSNTMGGLPMDYVEESPTKVWIRYLAPYWMGDSPIEPSAGPAVLGSAFGRAPYLGWHANNGTLLQNPRLVFVHTQSLCDGDPWDAGYFTLGKRDFAPGQGYLRRVGEWGPRFVRERAPQLLHGDWPAERRWRALRNYAIDFTASRMATLPELVGVEAASAVVEHAFTLVMSARHTAFVPRRADGAAWNATDAARALAEFLRLTGDATTVEREGDRAVVVQREFRWWRTEPDRLSDIDAAVACAWSKVIAMRLPGASCRMDNVPGQGARWVIERRTQ
jgi:hypothetical protein